MSIFEIIRRLIDAGAGRVITEAEQLFLHEHLNNLDPAVPSAEEQAAEAAKQQAAAQAEQTEFAAFQAWKAARDQAPAGTGG